jgi:hypothetical protein
MIRSLKTISLDSYDVQQAYITASKFFGKDNVNFFAIDGMSFFLGFKEKANGVKASLLKSNQDQLS